MDTAADLADNVTLGAHRGLTNELAASLRGLGDVRAAVVRVHAETWRNTGHLAVTERRETCRVAVADLQVEEAKLQGEVDALRAEINNIEIMLRYHDAAS